MINVWMSGESKLPFSLESYGTAVVPNLEGPPNIKILKRPLKLLEHKVKQSEEVMNGCCEKGHKPKRLGTTDAPLSQWTEE